MVFLAGEFLVRKKDEVLNFSSYLLGSRLEDVIPLTIGIQVGKQQPT